MRKRNLTQPVAIKLMNRAKTTAPKFSIRPILATFTQPWQIILCSVNRTVAATLLPWLIKFTFAQSCKERFGHGARKRPLAFQGKVEKELSGSGNVHEVWGEWTSWLFLLKENHCHFGLAGPAGKWRTWKTTNNRMIAFRDFWLGMALERLGTFLTIPIMRLRKPLRSRIIGFFTQVPFKTPLFSCLFFRKMEYLTR